MGIKVSTSIVLYKNQTKKNGKHPVKLRVTFNRKQMYYGIDTKERVYEFAKNDFEKVLTPKPRGVNKDIQLELSLIENKAQKIIASMDNFSFREFKTRFGIAGGDLSNILYYFERRIKEFSDNDQLCSWAQFTTAMRNLKRYFGSSNIDFRELTIHELEKYERWMISKNLSLSSIKTYMASTRTIFKIAHREGAIPKDIYPFGRDGYILPEGRNIKKALKINEIEKIYNYSCDEFSSRDEAKDLWLFSYLMNGANMNDIVRLKYKDIDSDFITFIRRKTQKTCKSAKPISVPLTDDLERIINKWGNRDHSPNNYVFSIITEDMTEKKIRRCLDRLIKRLNDNMKKIAKEVGIEKTVTTYTARHSFSTVLKRSGVSTEFISESLGHNNLRTTELYLDSFEDDKKKEVAKHLTAFSKQ